MNRRALILAGLATLPAVLARPASARRRPHRARSGGAPPATRRRQGGGLVAGGVRTRIVSRTFTSPVPMLLPGFGPGLGAASPYPSTIRAGGFPDGRITKVRATLIGLTHTAPSVLQVQLVAPGNIGVILMGGAGDLSDITNVTITLDQDAAGRLPDTLVSGTFQPLNRFPNIDGFPPPAPQGVSGHSLTRFNNLNPNGVWQLFIFNQFSTFDIGTLAGWSLTIQALVRVPRRPRRRPRQQRSTRRVAGRRGRGS